MSTIRERLRRFRLPIAATVIAAAIPLAAMAGPTAARADTTPPTGNDSVVCHGEGSCNMTLNLSGSNLYVALFVSSDGPDNGPQTIQVRENEGAWGTLQTSISDPSPAGTLGYTGIFTAGPYSNGTHVLTISQGTSQGNVWAEAYVFNNSSGFTGAASASTETGNPVVNLTSGSSSQWAFCVSHNWSAATPVYTGATGNYVQNYFTDNDFGDTVGLYSIGYSTAANQTMTCGHGSPSWAGDDDLISGIVVKGT